MKKWFKCALVRAIKTICQTMVALVGTSNFYEIDYKYILGTSVLAGVLSILTSIAGIPEAKEE